MSREVKFTYTKDVTDSSVLDKIWYNVNTRELYVRFVRDGSVAGYGGVSPVTADELADAPSVGRFYALNIKPNRSYKGLDGDVTFVDDRVTPESERRIPESDKYTITVPGKYTVTGQVLAPVMKTESVDADSIEAAIDAFSNKWDVVEITEVKKNPQQFAIGGVLRTSEYTDKTW